MQFQCQSEARLKLINLNLQVYFGNLELFNGGQRNSVFWLQTFEQNRKSFMYEYGIIKCSHRMYGMAQNVKALLS